MFSEKQIKEMTLKSLENEDVKVKTIEQSEVNWEKQIEFPNIENFTKLNEFCAFQLVNKTLKVVGLARYRNETETAQTFKIGTWSISDIPTEIGSKIYDAQGKTLNEEPTLVALSNVIRLTPIALTSYGSSSIISLLEVKHGAQNTFELYNGTSLSVPSGAYAVVCFEFNLVI